MSNTSKNNSNIENNDINDINDINDDGEDLSDLKNFNDINDDVITDKNLLDNKLNNVLDEYINKNLKNKNNKLFYLVFLIFIIFIIYLHSENHIYSIPLLYVCLFIIVLYLIKKLFF
jgi:hypothetical protein